MPKVIDRSIDSAMEGSVVIAPVVSLKVRKNGKRAKQVATIRHTEPPSVSGEVVRIVNECDPVGFLSDVVNGKAIECHVVDEEGQVQTFYETPNLAKRVEVAKFLAERYMPKVAVTKHAHLVKDAREEQGDNHGGRQNFSQIITHAANASDSED